MTDPHHILVVDDEGAFRELYARTFSRAGLKVSQAESAESALAQMQLETPDVVVSDVRMPGGDGIRLLKAARQQHPELPFVLVTAYADVRDAVTALRLGAVDYLSKPVDLDELLAGVQDLLGLGRGAPMPDVPAEATAGIVAEGAAFRSVLRDAWRVADSEATVLLTGESGTGKEVLARFIHQNSARRDRPMVTVNCAAIPPNLLASELFGHERGAFTGASSGREGHFRRAHRGTLFLDEIGDMPLEVQPTLLRAVEQRTVAPLGGRGDVPVDIRLIAATNQDLEARVADGRFRADLYYRLNVIAVELPPLRERCEDIVPLARHFLTGQRLSRAASRLLKAHAWPGNVRELANAMERAALLGGSDVILPEHLPPALRRAAKVPLSANAEGDSVMPTLQQTEVAQIREALATTGGNRTHAADLLGISRRGLIKKMKRFGIQ